MLSSFPSFPSFPSFAESARPKRAVEEEDMVVSPAKRAHLPRFGAEHAAFGAGWTQAPLFGLGFPQQSFPWMQAQEEQQAEAEQRQAQGEQSAGVQASITRFFRPAIVASSSSSSRRRAHSHSSRPQEQQEEQEQQEQQMETVVCSACIVPSMTDTSFIASCAFCERAVCGNCVHECSGCQQGFCKFCCTTTYDSAFERVACFACAQESSL